MPYDEGEEAYYLEFDYEGDSVELKIVVEDQEEAFLEQAYLFYSNINEWILKAKNFATRDNIDNKNGDWLEEGEKELTEKESQDGNQRTMGN